MNHLVVIPNFEEALFGVASKSDKPYSAVERIRTDKAAFAATEKLLLALIDSSRERPKRCTSFDDLDTLRQAWEATVSS